MPVSKAAPKKPVKKTPEREDGAITGNLTADPELRFTASGLPVANCRVAVQDRYLNEDTGEWEDAEPEFFTVNVWRQQAEHVAESLSKGDRIVTVGYFQDREYENQSGEMITVREFTAREIGPSLLFRDVTIKQPIARRKGKLRAVQGDDTEPAF